MLTAVVTDLRWAFRLVRRRPLTSAAVAATLSVAIAVTTVAYGLATSVLWRPLPFADPDRLVFVWEASTRADGPAAFRVTSGRFAEWRTHATSFSSMALFGAAGFAMADAHGRVSVRGVRASASYFDTLGVAPRLGRAFTAGDERPGQEQVVVVSHEFWRQRLDGQADTVGRTVRFDGRPYTVIGVMPPIVFPGWPSNPATVSVDATSHEFWIPIARTPELDANTRAHVFGVIGRLAPGVSLQQATDELTRLASPSAAEPHAGMVHPIREQFVRDARAPLMALVGAALALLLVACANLAALQVAAFEARRSEMATRSALGAGAGRLARQLATESLLIAGAACFAGLLAARWALAELPAQLPASLPLLTPAVLDGRVALVAVVAALFAGLTIAAWPLGRLLLVGPAPRGVPARARGHVFRALVTAQVAMTLALVVAAALLGRSLWTVQARDPGFQIDGIVVTDIGLPRSYDTPQALVSFEDRLRHDLAAQPGVRAVALAYDHPLEANWIDSFTLAGAGGPDAEVRGQAELRIVSASYFDTMGVEVVTGRPFTDDDGFERPGVALVNEAFARTHGGPIVGRSLASAGPRLTWGPSAPGSFEILGVVENERFRGLEQPATPAVYMSTRQFPQPGGTLLVSSAGAVGATARDLRAAVRAVEPGATVDTPVPLAGILRDQLAARRVTADVIGSVAALALGLAALGVYGVVALLVASRTREIGIRLALGAAPAGVARGVVGESLVSVVPGVVLGVVLALAAGRLVDGLLVGVSSRDPLTIGAVAVVLLATASVAALAPAVRAARVDPAVVLRSD